MTELEANSESIDSITNKLMDKDAQGKEGLYHPDDSDKNLCNFYRIKPTQIKKCKTRRFIG